MNYALIMAGGVGMRFWPLSTRNHPKQFCNIGSSKTMIENTVERILPIIPHKNQIIATSSQLLPLLNQYFPNTTFKDIIPEPMIRNTAPCIAYAAYRLYKQDMDATMLVMPADHDIKNKKIFEKTIKNMLSYVSESPKDVIMTCGIMPKRPETGYGYIYAKTILNEPCQIYNVDAFTEKPDLKTANTYLKQGSYYWNSGIFCWKARTILEQFRLLCPDIYALLEKYDDEPNMLTKFFELSPSISIDYAILEHANNVAMIATDMDWNDLGSWRALYEWASQNKIENAILGGNVITHNSEGNLILSSKGKNVALIGVHNLAVIETDKAILVCNLDQDQSVKDISKHFRDD